MSGKAIARVTRSRFCAESALVILLVNMLQKREQTDFTVFKKRYDKILANDLDSETLTTLITSEEFDKFCLKLSGLKNQLGNRSRTAKFRLLFVDYIGTVKKCIS